MSVVIPVRNGVPLLAEQLQAMSGQRCEADWEVIVSDNGSTDETVAEAWRFKGAVPRLQVLRVDRPGQASALNAGISASLGRSVVCLDHDDVVGAGYLKGVLRALEHTDLAGGRFDHRLLNSPWTIVSEEQVDGLALNCGRPYSTGAALSFHRSVFDALSGFATDVGVGHDVDFCWRAADAGFSIAFVPDAVLHYRHRARLSETWRQGLGYGRGDTLLRRKHGMQARGWREHADRARKILRFSMHPNDALSRYRAVFQTGILVGSFARVRGSGPR